MPRLLSALNEWLELRARVRDERQFHLERAAADLGALGLTTREATRMARVRFGGQRTSQTALQALGGDLRGLVSLFRAYRVATSVWVRPIVLIAAGALVFAVSPSPREIGEGMLGRTFGADVREAVALSVYGAGPASPGITQTELDALQSMTTVTSVESSGPHQVRAQPVSGVTLAAITSEAVARTGNRGFYAAWILRQPRIQTNPAKVICLLVALYGVFFLYTRSYRRVTLPWLLYAVSMACLHSAVSILVWALATQIWHCVAWRTPTTGGLSFSLLAVIYLLATAAQCRYWWLDLRHRCPVCLNCLLLSRTQGDTSRIVLGAAVTESVCARGHGLLIETRWSRDFRLGCSPLGGPTRA